VFLGYQYIILCSIPPSCPVLVSPANTKWKVETIFNAKEILDWFFQKPLAAKPIVMETKTINAVVLGKFHLPSHNIDVRKIIKPHVYR
jgi:hypothetical protein